MKPNSTRPRPIRGPLLLAGLIAIAGTAISLHLRTRIAQTEFATAQLTANALRLDTQQELNRFAEVLESVRALHALSDAVDQAAMDEFIEKGLVHQHAILGAFGLAQRIGPPLRFILEQEASNGTGGYRVVQAGPNHTWIPADPRPAHYPLTWQSRTGSLNIPVGFDFASLPQALRTIQQIEKTRRTAIVPSPNPFSDARAYWVLAPVIPAQLQTSPPPILDNVIGFACAELTPDDILQRVSQRSSLSPQLDLLLQSDPTAESPASITRANGAWHYRHALKTLDAQWLFKCSLPTTATDRRSTSALALGLVITTLLTSLLLLLATRTKKIETEVCIRTNQLHLANQQLEENLRERMQLEEQIHELAARERRRIGRDLHDSLGQKLTGAVFLSRSLMDPTPSCNRSAHARTLNETLKSAVAQVRNMARGLAPITLNDERLDETLDQLAEEMTELYGISCELTERAVLPGLSQKTKEQLYLIAREAVNNAARHANADGITLHITGNTERWTLSIRDNGQGLPATPPPSAGMGLRIMQHRADLIGATFTTTSAPGQGTTITISSNPPQ